MANSILEEDFKYILNDKNIEWEKFAGKTVLVSGVNGYLPAYMIQTLLYLNELKIQESTKIIGLVRDLEKAQKKYKEYLEKDYFKLIKQDVSVPFDIEEKVDFIIHAASQANPKYFLSDPVGVINANCLGTNNLLSVAKEKKAKSFLYFSSGEVNGDMFEKKNSVSENDYGLVDPLKVRSCYPESKRMGENMCACWHHQYGIPTKIVRPCHTYGPGFNLDDERAFMNFVASVINNKNIVLKSDGSAKRSFCYLADATRAYFLVLLNGVNGEAYNVGNEYEISILDLAKIIIKLSNNKNLRIVFDKNLKNISPSSNISHGLMSINKIKALGWSPKIKEKEGLARTINSFLEAGE